MILRSKRITCQIASAVLLCLIAGNAGKEACRARRLPLSERFADAQGREGVAGDVVPYL